MIEKILFALLLSTFGFLCFVTANVSAADFVDNSKNDLLEEKRVVIGMTGGVDSIVAAFLLQKQGFQCIGIGIVFVDEEEVKQAIIKATPKEEEYSFGSTAKKDLTIEEKVKFLQEGCSVKDLDKVNAICARLDIPFYAVNAKEEYKEYILDPFVASKLSGDIFIPCVACNGLKMDILYEKAKLLNATYIATGHYAKIYRQEDLNCYHIYSSNDDEYDQSYFLSNLQQRHLEKLILPLADLRKKDVIKIAETFGLPNEFRRDSRVICFNSKGNSFLIEAYSAPSFRPEGVVINNKTDMQYGEHRGVHHYFVGQTDIPVKEGIGRKEIERDKVVVQITPPNKVFVGDREDLTFNICAVNNVLLAPFFDTSTPATVFIRYAIDKDRVKAMLYFKALNVCLIQFEEEIFGLAKGLHLTFYDKEKQGGKVIGSGKIFFLQNSNFKVKDESDIDPEQLEEEKIKHRTALEDGFSL
ncbi:MAG: tRNA-specific 2-thiouridylase [Oligoflexia bacterium]|nr:tRNA-specific 2-thiouridylase [Oligoflexia bacterium]